MDNEKLNKAAEEQANHGTHWPWGDRKKCFISGAEWFMRQPLSERLTEEEKNKAVKWDINEFQRFALSTADPCAKDPLYLACGLCEEAGEVAGKVKKTIRDNDGHFDMERRYEVALELSDVLWYLANQATQMGFNLSEIAELNIRKVKSRIERNTLHGSGDNR